MGKLIYLMNVSLDGYVETPDHGLDWSVVDDELHQWFNDRFRTMDASLYGRRLYETMAGHWPTADADPNTTPVELEFREIWMATPKIIFSSTLESVDWNSRLVRGDPVAELARLREEFSGDLEVAGPTLASSFIRNGLVDTFQMVIHPVAIGAGKPYLPALDAPIQLRLTDSHVFKSGATFLSYERV
jgi:dihydrofolate reductase